MVEIRRQSLYVNQIKELRGRLEYAATPYEDHVESKPMPAPPPVPGHLFDNIGKHINLCGESVEAMAETALELATLNPILEKKLLDLIMTAKLIYSEDMIMSQKRGAQKYERKARDHLLRNSAYQRKVRQAEEGRKQLEKNWKKSRDNSRKKWKTLLEGLLSLIKIDNRLSTMHDLDQQTLKLLSSQTGKVEIKGDTVVWMNFEGLLEMPLEDIAALIEQMHSIYEI